jgi:hypothetical protein
VPVESVARATIEAVERGALPRIVHGSRFVVWAAQSFRSSRPWLQRLMRARIQTLVAEKPGDARPGSDVR